MSTEYRVIWRRVDSARPKRRRYMSVKRAERLLNMLTSNEPWLWVLEFKDKDPDSLACCDGHECGCGGLSIRQHLTEKYKDMPAIEYARIESREVGEWKP